MLYMFTMQREGERDLTCGRCQQIPFVSLHCFSSSQTQAIVYNFLFHNPISTLWPPSMPTSFSLHVSLPHPEHPFASLSHYPSLPSVCLWCILIILSRPSSSTHFPLASTCLLHAFGTTPQSLPFLPYPSFPLPVSPRFFLINFP